MKSKLIDKMLLEIPLDIRLRVAVESHFIHEGGGQFFIPADEEYTPDGDTIPLAKQIMDKNAELIEQARPILNIIDEVIRDWVADGGIIQLKYKDEDESEIKDNRGNIE